MFAAGKTDGAVAVAANYIEEVFSTYLYTGNGSTQTITNNIDLSTKGGLVWIKDRTDTPFHVLTDTTRGVNSQLYTNSTADANSNTSGVTAFNSNGFNVGSWTFVNTASDNIVSWTFREQPKFFDVLTYTGNGSAGRTLSHSLASQPGFILIKRTDGADPWLAFARLNGTDYSSLRLNTTAAGSSYTQSDIASSTVINVGYINSNIYSCNISSETYVVYIFAHDAGGFGLTGTDNVISCGSFTASASETATVTLGYEPQWLLFKPTSTTGDWQIVDNMRRWPVGSDAFSLKPNTSGAEANFGAIFPTATGFQATGNLIANATYIYIAIRRGPMAVPTSGTSVFGINARTGTGSVATVTGGQTDDAVLIKNRGSAVASLFSSRLTGTGYLVTSSTAAEVAAGTTILQANPWDVMDGVKVGTTSTITNASGNTFINYLFKRAPSFFDEVCYTGAGSPYSPVAHNLTVVPQMIIGRFRSDVGQWYVYHEALGATGTILFNSNAVTVTAPWTLTNTTFQYDTLQINTLTYVTYLFATLAGVSKVGSYTGNGTTQTIDCGFGAGGARFVLIKRTDASGDWYVYDTARGMTVLTDPYYLINSTAAEVATLGSVTTVSTGFAVDNSIVAGINAASPAAYIFLAIA